jgi:proteic killer suppression protein
MNLLLECQALNVKLTHCVHSTIDNNAGRTHILVGMKIVFAEQRLSLIHTDKAHELGLPFAVIKGAREKLIFLAEAPDERTLRNWKSLRYKKLEGTKNDERQIRINDQFRIVFTIDTKANPPVITITKIGDPH